MDVKYVLFTTFACDSVLMLWCLYQCIPIRCNEMEDTSIYVSTVPLISFFLMVWQIFNYVMVPNICFPEETIRWHFVLFIS